MDKKDGSFLKKKVYFSQISNYALRDKGLSLKAKGLYSLIQSYISLDGFTLYKNTLKKQCSEGKHAFESAWKELKDNGYLVQHKVKDLTTGEFHYKYELLDEKVQTPISQTWETQVVENPDLGNPVPGKPGAWETGVYNNTDLNNTDLNNTKQKYLVCLDKPKTHDTEKPRPVNSYPASYSTDFETFWQAYPRRKGKRAAFKNWNTRLKQGKAQGVTPDKLITAAKHYAAEMKAKGKELEFTKLPATFLGPTMPFEEYIDPPKTENRLSKPLAPYHKIRR